MCSSTLDSFDIDVAYNHDETFSVNDSNVNDDTVKLLPETSPNEK